MKHHDRYLFAPCPDARPLTGNRLCVPELWRRAQQMFESVLDAIGGKQRLAEPRGFTRHERREILGWLVPVEKLARTILLARAVTRLLMTPEGRKLMRETPKQTPWAQPEPARPEPYRTQRIPYPGWQTISQPPPRAPAPQPKRSRGCAFRVLRCRPPEFDSATPLVVDLWSSTTPSSRRPPPRSASASAAGERPSQLARRIDALARALENPERIVRRLSRFLAGLPKGLISLSSADVSTGPVWHHGAREFADSLFHARRAMSVLERLEPG